MKTFCAKSGIVFNTGELFNYDGIHAVHEHGIFSLNTNQLLGLFEHIYTGERLANSETEQYLLCLALLNKLPNQWKVQINKELALPITLKFLEPVAKLVERLNSDRRYLHNCPSIVIDKTTNDLRCLPDWIAAYTDAFNESINISAEYRKGKAVSRLETVIDSLIAKGFDKNKSRISKVVANWAVVAGDFPNSVKELWMEMVEISFADKFIEVLSGKATLADYDELVEHCEDYIPHGSTLASVLMKKIRSARAMLQEFEQPTKAQRASKLANVSLADICSDSEGELEIGVAGTEKTIKVKIGLTGVAGQPKKSDYPDTLSYIRDLTRWRKQNGLS